jgi:hypothetical protein
MNDNAKVTFDVREGLVVKLDAYELLRALTPEQRMDLVRHAAIDEVLYKDLVDQLVSGVTECDSWCSEQDLQRLRELLMPLMTDVAARAVSTLIQERDAARADAKRHSDWAWKMRHSWPREFERTLPPLPDYAFTWRISDVEARAVVSEEVEGEP